MGYYVDLTDYNLRLKPELDPQYVLQQLQATMFSDDVLLRRASGGASPQRGEVADYKWYSWTNTRKCRAATTLEEVLQEFFDDVCIASDGTWELSHSNKSGDEDVLLEYLAPYLQPGSYADWRGEDGSAWRWAFDGARMHMQLGRTVWE
jgi:hypothetical protein